MICTSLIHTHPRAAHSRRCHLCVIDEAAAQCAFDVEFDELAFEEAGADLFVESALQLFEEGAEGFAVEGVAERLLRRILAFSIASLAV